MRWLYVIPQDVDVSSRSLNLALGRGNPITYQRKRRHPNGKIFHVRYDDHYQRAFGIRLRTRCLCFCFGRLGRPRAILLQHRLQQRDTGVRDPHRGGRGGPTRRAGKEVSRRGRPFLPTSYAEARCGRRASVLWRQCSVPCHQLEAGRERRRPVLARPWWTAQACRRGVRLSQRGCWNWRGDWTPENLFVVSSRTRARYAAGAHRDGLQSGMRDVEDRANLNRLSRDVRIRRAPRSDPAGPPRTGRPFSWAGAPASPARSHKLQLEPWGGAGL